MITETKSLESESQARALEEGVLKKYRGGLSMMAIEKETGVTVHFIRKWLKKHGVTVRQQSFTSRKHSVNENYFDAIDSPTKAYFLGLLFSDGCNYERSSSVQIQLQKRDCAVLEYLNNEIENQRPIRYFSRKTKSGELRDYGMLRIHNQKLSKRLFDLGVVYRKSRHLQGPVGIPEKYINSFVLGFFDGDGSISYFKKRDQYGVMFFCNEKFGAFIVGILEQLGVRYGSLKRAKKKKTNMQVMQIQVSNVPDMIKVTNWMRCPETERCQILRKKERMDALKVKVKTMPLRHQTRAPTVYPMADQTCFSPAIR